MDDNLLAGFPPPDPDVDLARRTLADEIRVALRPHLNRVRRLISNWIDDHRVPIDLLPLPTWSLSVIEKCAVLAAFHDCVDEAEPFWLSQDVISPDDNDDTQSTHIARRAKEIPWTVLTSAACKIVPRPHDPLRTTLSELLRSLANDDSITRDYPPSSTSGMKLVLAKSHSTALAMAMSELFRVAELIRPLLTTPTPKFGLFTWTQELTGYPEEGHRTISLVDAAGALGGKPINILWCGAEMWRQPMPLKDEHGNPILKPEIRPDGMPRELHGKPLVAPAQSPIEFRGIGAVDLDYCAELQFLSSGLTTGFSGGVKTDLLRHLHTAGESLAKLPTMTTALWDDQVPPPYSASGAGPLILWFSAIVTLQEQGKLIGELVKPLFWHWRVNGPNLCEFVKPGTEHTNANTTRRVAVIADPVRASLQTIDWLESIRNSTIRVEVESPTVRSVELNQFKSLLIDDIFSQALNIAEKLKNPSTYGPETFYSFKSEWDRLEDGLKRAGADLRKFPPVIRDVVERLAGIINEAKPGPGYADVCRVLAESDLECARRGWREFCKISDGPAISWCQAAESEIANPKSNRTETTDASAHRLNNNNVLRSLLRVRDRFSKAVEKHRAISALLVHHAQICFPEPPDWPDGIEAQGLFRLNIRSGPISEPKQLIDENGSAMVAQQPVLDLAGKPILLRDGQPAAMYLGGSRKHSLYGSQFPGGSEWDYSAGCDEYMNAAAEAGRIIDDLPTIVKQLIWCDWPHGFIKPDLSDLWTNAIFELAWQDHAGCGLSADRWTWWKNKKLNIGDIAKTRTIPLGRLFSELLEHAGDPPRYWYSWLANVWWSSIGALDILESILNGSVTEPADADDRVTDSAEKVDIAQLERSTPALDKNSADWIRANDRQMKSEASTDSLKTMRHATSEGALKNADGTFGVDKSGRRWRKDFKDSTIVYYWRHTLKSRRVDG